MDRIEDSGSSGWGSIPHGGTRKEHALGVLFLFGDREKKKAFLKGKAFVTTLGFKPRTS